MKNILVKMPRWISIEDFTNYLNITKFGIENNSVFTFNKLLLLSDFFENNEFVGKLVKENIVPNFDYSNVIDYLENSYLKLSSSKENSLPVNISWFELFIKSIDFVSKNFVFYLNPDNSEYFDKLKGLNKKILEELLDKSIEQIILNPLIFDDEIFDPEVLNDISQSNICENFKLIRHEIFEKLVDFLHNLRNTNNIFDLLMNEYLRISSEENVSEVNNIPNPTLSIDIPIDINNYYKEFTLDMNIFNRIVVFIVYYKKSDDSLNVSFKLNNSDEKNINYNIEINSKANNKNNNNHNSYKNTPLNNQNNKEFNSNCFKDLNKFSSFKILTFLSVVSLNDEKNKTQINVNTIANNYNKSAYPIYKINNFSKYIDKVQNFFNDPENKNDEMDNNENSNIYAGGFNGTIDFVNLKINLKLCNIHSSLTSFILKYFNKFYHDSSINKISKQFFLLLIKNRSINKHREDHVVIALLNWCIFKLYFNIFIF